MSTETTPRRLCGTVVTGLESVAASEVQRKLPQASEGDLVVERGKVWFAAPPAAALRLKGLNNLTCPVRKVPLCLEGPAEERQAKLEALARQTEWAEGLAAWEEAFGRALPGGGAPASLAAVAHYLQGPPSELDSFPYPHGPRPSFRVTCTRTSGEKKQDFTSTEASGEFGGAVQRLTGWEVKMKDYDVEVVLALSLEEAVVSVGLTKRTLGHRNLVELGPTAMMGTNAFLLGQLAVPVAGETFVDPMCGCGSIPLEAALEWPGLRVLAGDVHPTGVRYARTNFTAAKASADVCQWDARALPLRDASVDALVTDLPFGKRMGSKWDNRKQYPRLFREWARVVRPEGRMVLLTADRRNGLQTLKGLHALWTVKEVRAVNHGGTPASVFLCLRTENPV